MEEQRNEIREMLSDLRTRDQRLLFAVVTLVHIADSKAQLDGDPTAYRRWAVNAPASSPHCGISSWKG